MIKSLELQRPYKTPVAGVSVSRSALFISREFPPSIEMGAISCAQIARYFHVYGWTPVVLTARDEDIGNTYRERDGSFFDNSFVGHIVPTRTFPHPLDLYRWISRVRPAQAAGGTNTIGEAGAPGHEKHRLRRLMLSLLMVPDMATGWILPAIVAGCRVVRQTGVRMIFSSGPSWTNHLVAYAVAEYIGLPWVAHLRDPWATGALEWDLANRVTDRVQTVLERQVVRRANAVICVTEEHTALMRRAYSDLSDTKFVTVSNGYDNEEWHNLETSRTKHGERFVITYAGKIYLNRSPEAIFPALRTLIAEGEITREQLQINFLGWCDPGGRRSIAELASEYELAGQVNVTGPRGHAEVLQQITQSNLLLLLAEDLKIRIPGKTYEYLKSGRPILAITPKGGSVANLLRRIGGGWAVEPGDDAGIVAVLREEVRAWRQGKSVRVANAALLSTFDRRALTGKIAEVLDRESRQ